MIFFLEKKISPLKRPFFKFSDTKNDSCKKVKKLLKIKKMLKALRSNSGIRDSGSGKNLFRIPDPGGKKVLDPGSGSATLKKGKTYANGAEIKAKWGRKE